MSRPIQLHADWRAWVLVKWNWAQAARGPAWSRIMSQAEPYLRINGGSKTRIDGLNWEGVYAQYRINTAFLDNYRNNGAPKPQERYFDNFIAGTQRIGC